MKKITAYMMISVVFLGPAATRALADNSQSQQKAPFERDATYEEDLRWQSSDDQAVTPARVLRWLSGMRGSQVFSSKSSTEFVPIVESHDGRYRAIATWAIKF